MGRYDDIIELPHHRSQWREPMPVENRAAQFAPFAALSGHDEAIAETGRITNAKIELANEEKLMIERALKKALENHARVTITYFLADGRKTGGSYQQKTGVIKKIDEYEKTVTLSDGSKLKMEDLLSVKEG